MNRLRELRRAYHISQAQLAQELEVAQNTVSNWETGMRDIDCNTLRRLADLFLVSTDYLLCRTEKKGYALGQVWPVGNLASVPIVGEVRAGFDQIAQEEILGYEQTELSCLNRPFDLTNPISQKKAQEEEIRNYFYLRVSGDSMEPEIKAGDLALVHKEVDVESGQLAVVLIEGEIATIKKIIKKEHTVVLQAFNPQYPPRIFASEELAELKIIGRVVEIKRKF